MPPFLGGGSMIETVTMERHHLRAAAGPVRGRHPADRRGGRAGRGGRLPDRASAWRRSTWHEKELTAYALEALADGARAADLRPDRRRSGRGGTISFALDGVHPHDVGQMLDASALQVRVGHHCARPVCVRFGVPAMTRASFYLYTTTDEIDALVRGLEQVRKVFG